MRVIIHDFRSVEYRGQKGGLGNKPYPALVDESGVFAFQDERVLHPGFDDAFVGVDHERYPRAGFYGDAFIGQRRCGKRGVLAARVFQEFRFPSIGGIFVHDQGIEFARVGDPEL